MPYSSNIPGVNDKISISQDDMMINFEEIKNLIDVNHITFDDPSGNQGKHPFVSIPSRDDSPPTISKEVGIYSAPGVFSKQTELYVKKQNNPSPYPITEISEDPNNPSFFCMRLTSGLLIKVGFIVIPKITVTIPVWIPGSIVFKNNNMPEFTNVFTVLLTSGSIFAERINAAHYVVTSTITTSKFDVVITNIYNNVDIQKHILFYLAIGM